MIKTEDKEQLYYKSVIKEFMKLPGVGKSIANDLWQQGFRKTEELIGKDPNKLYKRQCEIQGLQIDRCLLYVFRCVVYYVSNPTHNPELLKWWNWKNRE